MTDGSARRGVAKADSRMGRQSLELFDKSDAVENIPGRGGSTLNEKQQPGTTSTPSASGRNGENRSCAPLTAYTWSGMMARMQDVGG